MAVTSNTQTTAKICHTSTIYRRPYIIQNLNIIPQNRLLYVCITDISIYIYVASIHIMSKATRLQRLHMYLLLMRVPMSSV